MDGTNAGSSSGSPGNSAGNRSGPSQSLAQRPPTYVGTRGRGGESLADVLERVLDKGIVIVGDIQVRLLDIELLTIKIRLMIASVDKAREMGINWWEGDPFVSSLGEGEDEDGGRTLEMERRVAALEQQLADATGGQGAREQLPEGRA
jgi:Gas vesicle protein